MDTNTTALMESDSQLINLDDIMPSIERRAKAHQRFIQIMDQLVNPDTDLENFDGVIRRNINYAKKVFRVIGGRFEYMKDAQGRPMCNRIDYKDDIGPYYVYETYGRYIMPNGETIEQSGMFSSRDKFFGKTTDASGNKMFKSVGDVDERSVRQASQTECFKKCIFVALGLGDVDEVEMARYGVKTDKVQKQSYGKGTQGGNTDTDQDKVKRDEIKTMCATLQKEGFKIGDKTPNSPEDILTYLTECDYTKDGKKEHFSGWKKFDAISARALSKTHDLIKTNYDEFGPKR